MKNSRLITALVTLGLSANCLGSINPSSAMPEALMLGQNKVLAELAGGPHTVLEAHVGLGKYGEGSMGDYSVELVLKPKAGGFESCYTEVHIRKVFAGESYYADGFIVLEQVQSHSQDYKIIAKLSRLRCK